MALRNFSNTAVETQLVVPVDGSVGSMVVSAVDGYPAPPFVILVDPDTLTEEACLVTYLAGTTLTVTRGYNSTPALPHSSGATVTHAAIAMDFKEANEHVNATDDVHGVLTNVTGIGDVQTLTNKSMSGIDNTFSDIPQDAIAGLDDTLALKASLASPTFTGTVVLPATTSIGPVSNTEIGYLDGADSNIQDQLDALVAVDATKAPINNPTFTGTVTLPSSTSIGTVTAGEIAALDGVVSNLQTQIDVFSAEANGLPIGGTVGQSLVKLSSENYAATWATPSPGSVTGGDSMYLLKTQEFTGSAGVEVDTFFTSQFRNYQMIVEVTGTVETSLRFRMRSYSGDDSTATYSYQQMTADGASVSSSRAAGETSGLLGKTGTTRSYIKADILDPAHGSATLVLSQSNVSGSASDVSIYHASSGHSVATVFNGITIFPSSGTITGRIKVYGLSETGAPLLTPDPAPDPLVLFDYGDEKIDVTGGWTATTHFAATMTKPGASLDCSWGNVNSSNTYFRTANAIDVSAYTRLYVETSSTDRPEGHVFGLDGAVGSPNVTINLDGYPYEVSLLVSPFNGSYVVSVGGNGANYGNMGGNCKYHKIWLQ